MSIWDDPPRIFECLNRLISPSGQCLPPTPTIPLLHRHCMHIPNLAPFHAKLVTIRRPAEVSPETEKHVDRTDGLVNHVAPIRQLHAAGHADVTRIRGRAVARVRAALEAVARCAPGNDDGLVGEVVKVPTCRTGED